MYGLSAKEKAARFQASSANSSNNNTSVSSRPRKIGKLNIGSDLVGSKSTTKKTTTKKVVKTKTTTTKKSTMKERKEQQEVAAADESVVAVLEKTDAAETTETTVASGFVISADVTTDEADVAGKQVESVVNLDASDTINMEVSVSTSEAEPEATAIDTPELSFSFTTSTDEPELDLSAELQVNAALQLTSADTTEVEEDQEEEDRNRKGDHVESEAAAFQISVDVSVDESATESTSQEVTLDDVGSDVTATVESVEVDVEGGVKEEAEVKVEEVTIKADEEDGAIAEEEAKVKAEEEARVKAEEEEATRLKNEEEGRVKAEEEARLKSEEEARLKAEEEARLKGEEEARLKAEEEARLKAEEEARLKAEEEARLKAEEEARKPKETETDKAIKKTFIESCPTFQPIPDEFYSKLFYFSGMGTLIGSSLSAGIYVPEDTAKCGLGAEQVESCVSEPFDKHVEMVKTARNHATDLTTELRKLQALLQGLPIFTGDGTATGVSSSQTWRQTRHTSLSGGATSHRTRASSYGGFTAAAQPPSGQPRVVQETFSSATTVPAQQAPVAPVGGYGSSSRAVSSSGYPGEAAATSGYGKGVAASTGAVASSSGYLKGVGTSTAYPTAVGTSANGYAGEPIVGAQYPFQLPDHQRGRVTSASARTTMHDETDAKMASTPQPTQHQHQQRPAPPPVQPKPRLVVTDAAAPPAAWTPRRRPWEQPAPDTLDVPRRRRARSLITAPAAPVSPVNKNYGVFTAQGRSWQDKYGKANVVDQPTPKPFGGGGVNLPSSGLKTWQMSRVRGLEARVGYRLDSEQVYIENTPARRASAAAAAAEASQIDSLSPYLVSAKSRVIDYAAKPMSPTSAQAFQPRVQNGYGGGAVLSPGLPYCDL